MGGKGRTSGDVQSICNLKTSFPTFLCRNQSLKTVIQQLLCIKGQWLWIAGVWVCTGSVCCECCGAHLSCTQKTGQTALFISDVSHFSLDF